MGPGEPMSVDLTSVIAKLLIPTGTVAALMACKCPPSVPAEANETIGSSAELAEALQADLDQQHLDGCDTQCDALLGEVTGVWTCDHEPRGALVATHVTCMVDGPEPTSERVDLYPDRTGDTGDTGTPPGTVATNDGLGASPHRLLPETCRDLCRETDGWQLALDAGYEDAGVPVGCGLWGETVDEAMVDCSYHTMCIGGRRPRAGLDCHAAPGVGAWWVAMAQLESASVPAFEELARDLQAHGAPPELVQRALQAADDERVHTRLCVGRAQRHGLEVVLPHVSATPAVADLRALAHHNAVEGCVREAFAALEAGWQARRAADPTDRAVLERIHTDEVRHGQLAWDIHAWARQRLGPALDQVVAEGFAQLLQAMEQPVDAPTRSALGLPAPARRRALATGLAAAVLAA